MGISYEENVPPFLDHHCSHLFFALIVIIKGVVDCGVCQACALPFPQLESAIRPSISLTPNRYHRSRIHKIRTPISPSIRAASFHLHLFLALTKTEKCLEYSAYPLKPQKQDAHPHLSLGLRSATVSSSADIAAMASESDDDAQAEKQVQMSLQCSAGHLVGPPHSEACEERPQFLHDTEVSGECGGAIGLLPKAQSSSNVAVAYSPKHCERSRSFEHADVLQLATSKFSGTGALQEDDAGRSSELRESTPHASHCCPAVHHSGSSPDVSSVVPESYLHAKRPSSHSDQDVSMKDVSSQAPIMDQITNEAVGTPATASPKAFTGTRSFTSMKPWSRFATSACSGSFKMYTISSALRFGSQWSSTERTGNKPSSSMLNQYIAQNQGSRLKLRHNGEGTYGIVETSNMLGQHVREPTPGSFETAREVRNTDHERDSSFRTGKQNDIFDGLHPDRLTMLSNGNALVPTAIPSESKGQGKQHGWKSTASNPRPLNTRQDIARAKKKKSENQEQTIADGKCSSSKSSSPKAEQHYLKNESNVAGFPTVGASLKFLPILETQFARKGIEYLKDRYPHLSSALPPGKEWSFAWQEIMTILRTTSSFDFIAWQGGFSVQLNTDFKVFRLRGPFQKKRGKAVITRRAVLHVIDGPYFFRRAAPALAGKCFRSHSLKSAAS